MANARAPRILAVNPGSTSTKIGLFAGESPIFSENVKHSADEMKAFPTVFDQLPLRLAAVRAALSARGEDPAALAAVVGRGGPIRPLDSGTYLVDDRLCGILRTEYKVAHVSLLGGLLARELASPAGIPAYIVDPVSVDEMAPIARLSGHPDIERISLAHALNLKAAARRAARELGRPYGDCRLVVAHLGSGTSVSAHLGGRMIDVENPADEGPISIDRTGGLPIGGILAEACSGRYTEKQLRDRYTKAGGVLAYLGTTDGVEIERRIASGDERARLVYEALVYQTAKTIGAYATVLSGDLHAVVVTGGLAHSAWIMERLAPRISFLGRLLVYPGEDELPSLAAGALRALAGEEPARTLA